MDNASLIEVDPFIYEIPQGIIVMKWIREIVSRYKMLPEYVYRLLGDSECISCFGPIKMAICE